MTIDFRVVNAALNPATVVPEWLPDGKKVGENWMARGGALGVNLTTGKWSLFSSDDRSDRGGDLVGLYAWIFCNKNQVDAARELMQKHGIVDSAEARERAAKVTTLQQPTYTPVMPVPADVPQEPNLSWQKGFKHPKLGMPTHDAWAYRDHEGRLLMYVVRYLDEDGTKQVVPWSWGTHPTSGKVGWQMRGLTGSMERPLYGLQKLAEYPNHDVLMVEGEKTADAAQELLGDACIVLSWMGGMGAADKARVTRLKDRKVYLWPDFDVFREKLTQAEKDAGVDPESKPILPLHEQGGARAMMAIASKLKGITADGNIRMIGYTPGEKPHGWDLADALAEGWTGEDVLKMLAERSRDPREVMAPDTPATAAAPATPPAPPASKGKKLTPLAYPVNEFGFERGDKGPLNTLENMEYMLGEYGVASRYNVISKEVEIEIPGVSETTTQDNHMEVCLAHIVSLCARNRMPSSSAPGYITTMADRNKYNPAADWVDSKPWDGKDRITALVETLDARDPDLALLLLRKWMVGAVAAIFEAKGFAMQGVIVLLGAQNAGKTTWIKHMAEFNEKLVKEAAVLNTADKDSIKQVVSYWLVELGELEATFSKSDITALRGFITQQVDEMRLPYARASSKFPRRTAFLASVNDRTYLRDETGNRRYWTIDCGENLNAMHDVDMQQAWAQAKQLYLDGVQHHLSKEDNARLAESNSDYTERNPMEDLIYNRFAWEKPATLKLSAAEVCIHIGYDKPSGKQAKDAATILRKFTQSEPKKSNGRLVFAVPPLKTNRYKDEGFHDDDNARPF